MKETTVILISAGKDAILQLHRRNIQKSLDDADYIPAMKSVIQGIFQVAEDAVGQQQVRQELLKYARGQCVQLNKNRTNTASYTIPIGFQDATRRQVSEAP